MDLSTAYPGAAKVLRGFALIDHRHVLIVDEITPKPDESLSSVVWQMHTAAHVGLDNSVATLIYPGRSDSAEPPRLYVRLIDRGRGAWTLRSAAPSNPEGQNPNAGVAKLVLRLEPVAESVRLAVMLSSDADAWASPELPLARQPLSGWI